MNFSDKESKEEELTLNVDRFIESEREKRDKQQAEEELKKEIFAKIDYEIRNAKIDIAADLIKPIENAVQNIKSNYVRKKDYEDKIVTRSEIAELLVNELTHAVEKIKDEKDKNLVRKLIEALKKG